jgi:hypothetical protein
MKLGSRHCESDEGYKSSSLLLGIVLSPARHSGTTFNSREPKSGVCKVFCGGYLVEVDNDMRSWQTAH